MSRQIQIRRGTAAQHSNFIGAIGEITMDTTNNTLRVHDGLTAGGHILAKKTTTLTGYGITDGADTALSNLTSVGKQVCSKMAMPSSIYDTLTLGVSGATYTAPADGYFYISKLTNGSNQYVQIVNETANKMQFFLWGVHNGAQIRGFVPVAKGDKASIGYTAGGATQDFKFIYAKSAE